MKNIRSCTVTMRETDSPKSLRRGILMAAAALILPAVFLLHRPLRPDEVPDWNPLVMGYTVVMLAAALLFLAAGGALILVSLSKKRATMRRRLFRLITFTAASLICVVILDVVVSLFPALEIWNKPAPLAGSLTPYCVPDPELGYRFSPNQTICGRFDLMKHSDLITTKQVDKPIYSNETEDGTEAVWRVDGDGYRNDTIPNRCDIFVVGDSFCMPFSPDESWTALVSKKTGMTLYNAGFPYYSFQQEINLFLKKTLNTHLQLRRRV